MMTRCSDVTGWPAFPGADGQPLRLSGGKTSIASIPVTFGPYIQKEREDRLMSKTCDSARLHGLSRTSVRQP